MTVTPLEIALQEYSYWRDHAIDDDKETTDVLLNIQMGALGASANIAARIAGAKPEGIRYVALTEEAMRGILAVIAAAPKMLAKLEEIYEFIDGENIRDPKGARVAIVPGSIKAIIDEARGAA